LSVLVKHDPIPIYLLFPKRAPSSSYFGPPVLFRHAAFLSQTRPPTTMQSRSFPAGTSSPPSHRPRQRRSLLSRALRAACKSSEEQEECPAERVDRIRAARSASCRRGQLRPDADEAGGAQSAAAPPADGEGEPGQEGDGALLRSSSLVLGMDPRRDGDLRVVDISGDREAEGDQAGQNAQGEITITTGTDGAWWCRWRRRC
jgi:hypothetical protein